MTRVDWHTYFMNIARQAATRSTCDRKHVGAVIVRGNRIEHWLNGHLVMEAIVGSVDWQQRVGKSKFADVDGFGQNRCGRIMLTDHGDEVWYRNVFIRRLSTARPVVSLTGPHCCGGSPRRFAAR